MITAARREANSDGLVISASFPRSSRTASVSVTSASGASSRICCRTASTARSASSASGPLTRVTRPNGDPRAAMAASMPAPADTRSGACAIGFWGRDLVYMCQGQKTSKGATVAGTLRTWVQGYVRAHRSRPTPPNFKPPAKLRRPAARRTPSSASGWPASPQVLERLVAVQPHTIAVVLPSDQPPQVKRPGEQLRPSLLSGRKPSYVVVVSTAVTRLDVTMRELVTRPGTRTSRWSRSGSGCR